MDQLNLFSVNRNEAPVGFYAVSKKDIATPNVCISCDARTLCCEDKDGWCLKNRCMGYEMIGFDGNTYKRNDGQSVVFKKVEG